MPAIAITGQLADLEYLRDALLEEGIEEDSKPDYEHGFNSIVVYTYYGDEYDNKFDCYYAPVSELKYDLLFTLPQDLDKALEAIKERVK